VAVELAVGHSAIYTKPVSQVDVAAINGVIFPLSKQYRRRVQNQHAFAMALVLRGKLAVVGAVAVLHVGGGQRHWVLLL
jgi:hypothetical protein